MAWPFLDTDNKKLFIELLRLAVIKAWSTEQENKLYKKQLIIYDNTGSKSNIDAILKNNQSKKTKFNF